MRLAFANGACRILAVSAILTANASAASKVTISEVTGRFFSNPSDDGTFTATPGSPVVFSQRFAAINFNPPRDAIHCSNSIDVDEWHRPVSDVTVRSGGSCSVAVAEGNGHQAGVGDLESFNAAFTGTFTVSAPGQVTFNIYADDGWILGIGRGPGGQPSFVSGPMQNAPLRTAVSQFLVVGAYNITTAPARQDLVLHFPAAGEYPFEVDYSECCAGQLALTLTADFLPITGMGDPYKRLVEPVGVIVALALIGATGTRIARNRMRRDSLHRRGFLIRLSGDLVGETRTPYQADVRGETEQRRKPWEE